uniref:MAGUK p55 scaffold protein 4 n=1 Tax=Scleropages formosus TaxID=113540 RepID=A0A8C9VZU4_SCLFO
VVEELKVSMRKQVSGADHLYSLLNAPWLQSLLKALLSSHDMVAQKDFNPVLPPLPDDLPNEEEAMRIVCLVKNNQPLGATIKKNEVTGEIFVARVIHGGLADRSGLLNMGDKLVEVNWQPVAGMDPEQIIEILTQSQGTIMFKLVPMSDKPVNTPVKLYMRAMVDYCPQHDPAIPCADAGVVFHKGNVLEVVDQTDALWWQARKLPSTSAFAGLIPSAELLKRWAEESVHSTCITSRCVTFFILNSEDMMAIDEKCVETGLRSLAVAAGFRRSLRLCRRKLASLLHQSRDNHYPSSSHSALTHPYEEVVLYQRRMQDKHRLVVLVGSSGVGVNELRRRLIERQPKIFQGPVPHTTRPPKSYEEPGREYHFIKKEQFENMADTQRFLEYAEYKGHLYGTSFDGIRDVLDKGMICIVDIEPHAIPSIRTQEFRPYIIFVKPPSCARMRKTRKNAQIITNYFVNRPFKEEDFQEIEEAAKKMEAQYGHFFDHVLVNDGLQDSCEQLLWVTRRAQDDPQWVPAAWLQPTGQS